MPDWDASEVYELAQRLATAPARLIPALMPTAHTAGKHIKADMVKDATGHYRLPGLPGAVEYEVNVKGTEVEVEVGFKNEGQGSLAFIAAFGTEETPAFMDITRGLYREAPKFARFVAKVAGDVL